MGRQASQCEGMDEKTSSLHPTLCSDQFQLAESGQALVWRTDLKAHPPRLVCSVEELQNAISEFSTNWNEKPKPFVWTATVESIQTKLARCRQTLEQIQPGSTLPRARKRKK